MSPAPVRLLDAADVPPAERALLEAGRAHVATRYDVDAGAARFRASLAGLAAAGVATAAGEAARGVGGKALFAKVLLSIAVGTTFVGVGVLAGMTMERRAARERAVISVVATATAPAATRVETPGPPSAARLPSAPAPLAAMVPEPANASSRAPVKAAGPKPRTHRLTQASPETAEPQTAAVAEAAADVTQPTSIADLAPEAAPAQPTAAPRQATPPAETRPPEAAHPLGELQGIAMARGLVARDPTAALGVLDRLRKDHPNGYFVEEREALTVLALAGDGQTALARQQASAFLRVFPNGPFSEQVREVLRR